jgi:hypothetical protein
VNEENILRFEVEFIVIEEPATLRWPSDSEFRRWGENGHLSNHHFKDLRGFDWQVAEMLIDGDKAFLKRASETCSSPEGFMKALDWAEEEILEGDEAGEYEAGQFAFEPGIHGAIGALAAVGCAPLTGCAGHFGNPPHIIFWCREDLFSLIRDAARATGMGLTCNQDGTLEAYAEWLPRMIDFAEKVLELGKDREIGTKVPR